VGIADSTALPVPNKGPESPSTAGSLSFTDLNGKLVYRSDCYVVITGSFAEEIYAINEVSSMKASGYTQSGYLWRMDYPSINDKYLYSTFLGPFQSYEECKMTLMPYKSSHRYAYGIKVSYENNRTEIR